MSRFEALESSGDEECDWEDASSDSTEEPKEETKTSSSPSKKWTCSACSHANEAPKSKHYTCEMCSLPFERKDAGGKRGRGGDDEDDEGSDLSTVKSESDGETSYNSSSDDEGSDDERRLRGTCVLCGLGVFSDQVVTAPPLTKT